MLAAALAAGAILLAPATVRAATPVEKSVDLWATVNICDTEAHPDRIGIRGSMPGLGKSATLYMRFQVHYFARADGKWHTVGAKGDTTVKVGVAKRSVLEAGRTFYVPAPADGGAHTLRAAVTFSWKRRGRVVKKLREITENGHRSTKGADPPGFSAATCQIS